MSASENLRVSGTEPPTAPSSPSPVLSSVQAAVVPPGASATPDTPPKAPVEAPSGAAPATPAPQDAAEAARRAANRAKKRAAAAAAAAAAVPAPTPAPVVEPTPFAAPLSADVLKEMRRKRARKLLNRVLAMVVLPTLLSAVYFGLIASSEFESTSLVVVERRQPPTGLGVTDDAPGTQATEISSKAKHASKTPTTGASRDDALLVKEFLLSRTLLDKLDKQTKLLDHYRGAHVDWISRLSPTSSREKALEYYRQKVTTQFDSASGLLTIKFRAYDGALAAKVSKLMLQQSEQMLNALGTRAEKENLKLAAAELERTRAISLELTAKAVAAQERALAQTGGTARSVADQPKAVVAAWTPAVEQAELAQQRLARAEQLVSVLTDELAQKDRYVVRVSGPSKPDEASYPRRGRAVLTTFLVSVIAMGILSLLFSAVREHTNL